MCMSALFATIGCKGQRINAFIMLIRGLLVIHSGRKTSKMSD